MGQHFARSCKLFFKKNHFSIFNMVMIRKLANNCGITFADDYVIVKTVLYYYCNLTHLRPGWILQPQTSAKRWPASDTLMLHPDSPSLDSTSCASCASCIHAPDLVASGASGVPCLYWVPSGHMQRSNPASHASWLNPQHHRTLGFTTPQRPQILLSAFFVF